MVNKARFGVTEKGRTLEYFGTRREISEMQCMEDQSHEVVDIVASLDSGWNKIMAHKKIKQIGFSARWFCFSHLVIQLDAVDLGNYEPAQFSANGNKVGNERF